MPILLKLGAILTVVWGTIGATAHTVTNMTQGDVDAAAAVAMLVLLIVYIMGARQSVGKYLYWIGATWLVAKLVM